MSGAGKNGYYSNGSYNGTFNGRSALNTDHYSNIGSLDLRRLSFLIWDYKGVIATVTALCVLIAWLFASLQTPIYQSSGSLMITGSKNQYSYAGSDLNNLLTNSYGIGLGSTVTDELQILRSRNLSQEVADTLMRLRAMENGKQFPILYADYPDDSTVVSQQAVAARLRKNLVYSQVDPNSNLIEVSYRSPSPIEAARIINLTIAIYSKLSTRQNRKSANAAVNFLADERERIEKQLVSAEEQLEQYMDQNELVQVDEQTRSLIERSTDLEQQRQEARIKLVAVNSGIERYHSELNTIKPGLADYFTGAVNTNLSQAQFQMAELQAEKRLLLSENPWLRQEENTSARLDKLNRRIDDYKEEIRSLTDRLLKESEQYLGFADGTGEGVTGRMAELHEKLIQLNVEQQQYEAQERVITDEIDRLEATFENLPENMTNLARLKRNVQINEELYLTVSKQFAEMSLWQQTQFGQGQLVDEGHISSMPVAPNIPRYLLFGFVLGLMISAGYIFVRETYNTTIDGAHKLKEFKAPLLAVVPDMADYIKDEHKGRETVEVKNTNVSTSLVSLINPISPISESFRRLEANADHSNPDTRLKSLLITSTRKGEGKTTIAANLGMVMAEGDEKVLIVDTDLRRPQLHNMFRVKRSPGIVDILFENASLEEAICGTVNPNLDILSAGSSPPNPPAITKSASFLSLLEELESRYDRVIYDTSPYGIITDSSSFIDKTDGIIIVTRFGETKLGELEHTLHSLERVDANVVGTILNEFDVSTSSDYYYGDNYYEEFYRDYKSYEQVS